MSDTGLNSISNVRPVDPGLTPRQPAPVQSDAAYSPAARVNVAAQEKIAAQEKVASQEKTPAQGKLPAPAKPAEPAPSALMTDNSNVSLKFRVDEETRDVTIFVVDRSSKKVLRSIPPGELAKMQAGDLLKLTA